jgi:uncharacterized protein YkwD
MRKKTILAALAFSAILAGSAPAAVACQGADRSAGAQSADSARHALTCLINHRRAHHGVRALRGDVALGMAAQEHSDAMASQNFFAHEGRDGSPASRAASMGYIRPGSRGWSIGENLGFGSGGLGSPRAMVRAWMASPEHRHVMLMHRWRQVGVGVSAGSPIGPDGAGQATYTVDFGHR